MIRSECNGDVMYDMEDGSFLCFFPDKGQWDFIDTMVKDKWNMGTYNVTNGRCYILTSSYSLDSRIIAAFRQEFGWVEWIEPKQKKKRSSVRKGINLKMLKDVNSRKEQPKKYLRSAQ